TVDRCGLCRLSQSAAFGGSSSATSATPIDHSSSSQSVDCSGNCRLPGRSKYAMVCGQCVRQSDQHNVIDQCGNCLSEGHPCSCDRYVGTTNSERMWPL